MMDPTTPLAARLKQATRELHHQAERSGVMADLLQGRITRAAYLGLLGELLALYSALEDGLEAHAVDANVRQLWRPVLSRRFALQQDMACLQTGARQPAVAVAATTRAGQAYVQRLLALAGSHPELLLAHAYVRYLGDLHGGQVLGRLVRERFALPLGRGTAFYDIGEPAQLELLRREFRAGLDALQLSPEQQQRFVAEACDAFQRHKDLFEELQRSHATA